MRFSAMRRFLVLILCLIVIPAGAGLAVTPAEIVDDPLVHGAWLYKVNCVRCHGSYEKERPGEEYRSRERLIRVIGEKGCGVAWSKRAGGVLSVAEIEALSQYIHTWEQLGKEPDLPVLPEVPKARVPVVLPPFQPAAALPAAGEEQENRLTPPLARLVAHNQVAQGAWFYTTTCYRCHLSYAATRQGRSMKEAEIRKIVENGKTSTQMTGFSVLAGGKLKNSEIDAILAYILTWEKFDGQPAIAAELLRPPQTDPAELLPIGLPRFPLVRGDKANGRRLFLQECSRCHNADRSGFVGRRLLPPWDSMRPDLFLKSTIKNGVPGTLMVNYSEKPDGALSPKQVDDLVTFLLMP